MQSRMATSPLTSLGPVEEPECSVHCYNIQHGRDVCAVAAASKGIEAVPLWVKKCSNYAHVQDECGRNALHVVSSTGNLDALDWLIKRAGSDINKKDRSGFTPLHRSVFHGQLHITRRLINYNADIEAKDNEGLTPLELCNRDCPKKFQSNIKSDPTELLVWGTNSNFTLGNTVKQEWVIPEQFQVFRKHNIQLMKAVISTYHSVFLSQAGEVFVCGSERKGILGLGRDNSVLQQPERLHLKSAAKCISVAAGVDHTMFLMENGKVFSCGSNELGIAGHKESVKNSLVPRPVDVHGTLEISGILAAKHHSVFYNPYQLFTCGWNKGQLGHQTKDEAVYEPQLVSHIVWDKEKEIQFTHFAVSTFATVARINSGIIYVLYNYDIMKINAKHFDVVKICVTSGEVDKHKKQDDHVVLFLLTSTGRIVIWRPQLQNHVDTCGTGVFSKIIFNLSHMLDISDMQLSLSCLLITTAWGEAYKAEWKGSLSEPLPTSLTKLHNEKGRQFENDFQVSTGGKRQQKGKDTTSSATFLEHMKLQKIKNIYSALSITSDEAGKNFGVIQSSPICMLTTLPLVVASSMNVEMKNFYDRIDGDNDFLCDLKLKVGSKIFPVHKYIIAAGCPKLHSIVVSKLKQQVPIAKNDTPVISIEDVDAVVFEQILQFIYSYTCDIMTEGKVFPNTSIDLIKATIDSARRLQLENLCKALKKYIITDGAVAIRPSERCYQAPTKRFIRLVNDDLCDLLLKSEDSVTFKAHKCILVARSEYFCSMLYANVWLEQLADRPITLHFSSKAVELILEFVYEDKISNLPVADVEALAEILIMSDNLFMHRLRTQIEASLADLLHLKNAADLLQLADRCNADQLKETCMELISMNLAAALEMKLLDSVPLDVLKQLTEYYRHHFHSMTPRELTVPCGAPSSEDLDAGMKNVSTELAGEIEASYNDEEIRKPLQQKPAKTRLRQRNRTSTSESDSKLILTPPTTPKPIKNEESTLIHIPASQRKVSVPLQNNLWNEGNNANKSLNLTDEFPTLDGKAHEVSRTPLLQEMHPQRNGSDHPANFEVLGAGGNKRRTKWKSFDLKDTSTVQNPVGTSKDESTVAERKRNPSNPWKVEGLNQKLGFLEILQDEVEKKENLERATTKPLSLMQIEDQVINRLITNYHSKDVEDSIEIVTVERVSPKNYAPPVWVQHTGKNTPKPKPKPKPKSTPDENASSFKE